MEINSQKPILVTGAHRSGTTWVGRMLAATPEACYVQEPFNIRHDPGLCRAEFKYWFTYISEENAQGYDRALRDTIRLRYRSILALRAAKRPGHLRKTIKESWRFASARRRNVRPLIKDPIAVFSSEWLARRFDMQVVVIIRHPAAFVGSLKVQGWTHPFTHFLKQPLLMRDHLADYEGDLRRYVVKPPDIVDQGSLLWEMIYQTLIKFKKRHPGWIYLRHEDLSVAPEKGFRRLYDQLGLTYDTEVKETVRFHSDLDRAPGNPPRYQNDNVRRNSSENVYKWKERLSEDEIRRVRQRVEKTAANFYSDGEW